MRPGHVLYGYRIKDGVAVIHEDEAKMLRKYMNYIYPAWGFRV